MLLGFVVIVLSLVAFQPFPSEVELRHLPRALDPPVPAGQGAPEEGSVRLVGAGDIAVCGGNGDEATAALVEALLASADGAAYAFTTGDNAYPDGRLRHYLSCYEPSWGRFLDHTIVTPGNHDYRFGNLDGYWTYFGGAAGDRFTTWYSREIGDWQLLVLDTMCREVDGCGPGSPQAEWLTAELALGFDCTLALMHRPRYSSGSGHGSQPEVSTFWRLLADAGAELVVSGHDHNYERFVPLDAEGQAAPSGAGIRQFVVGTGGAGFYDFRSPMPNSEVRIGRTHGVLSLELGRGSYEWEFLPVAGGAPLDSGSGECH